ncbi:unnamed protein product [Caenorhabditis nigoni]
MFGKNSGAFALVLAKDAWLPNAFLMPATLAYCTFFGTSMALFAVHFIYRYLAVTGSNLIKYHNNIVIAFLLLFPLIFGFFWYVLSSFTLGPFAGGDLFLRKQYLVDHDISLSEIYYVAYYFYVEDDYGNESINWNAVVGCSIQSAFIILSFGLIFYFGYKCYLHTKSSSSQSSTSSANINLQTQLFYALVFQTAIPVVLMHLPSTINISIAFFNTSMDPLNQVLVCSISLYPALDPLPNFFIIKNYRVAILGFFGRKNKKINVIQVTGVNEVFMSNVSKF